MKWRILLAIFSASAGERGPARVGFFCASRVSVKSLAGDVCVASVDLAGAAGAGALCE